MKAYFERSLSLLLLFVLVTSVNAGELPRIDKTKTAVLVTDPQNDFLHSDGKIYPLLEKNLKSLGTVGNIESLMKTAKQEKILLAVDPLVYTTLDLQWERAGSLQRKLLEMRALYRESNTDTSAFGADFYAPYKPYIFDGKTIVSTPHKMYGPESNDLIYQLRSHGINTVILGGMVANLCVDSHMRSLMENGFNVYVVKDAVAAPGEEAYQAALTNYGMIANGVLSTEEAMTMMSQ